MTKNTEPRFVLTFDEATGFYWLNDELTGKSYETGARSRAAAERAVEIHIACADLSDSDLAKL